jgi:hypothetical protein
MEERRRAIALRRFYLPDDDLSLRRRWLSSLLDLADVAIASSLKPSM